tara:strand:- start:563 stop:781 length:219 start_codon:yes stop_codon:yes gene_type:complete
MNNHFDKYNSTSSDEILLALAEDLGNMANAIFVKLGNGYFSEEDENFLNLQYRKIARMQRRTITTLRDRGQI